MENKDEVGITKKEPPFSGIWKTTVLIISLIIIIFFIFFSIQMNNAKKTFLGHVLKDAEIMSRLIEENIITAIISESAVETTLKSLLKNSADFTLYLDEISPFTNSELKAYASNSGLYGIYINREDSESSGPENWVNKMNIKKIFSNSDKFRYFPDKKVYMLGSVSDTGSYAVIGIKSKKINELKTRISPEFLVKKIENLPGIKKVSLNKLKEIEKEKINTNIEYSSETVEAKIYLDSYLLNISFNAEAYFNRISSIKKEFFIFIFSILFSGVLFSWILIRFQKLYLKKVTGFEKNLAREKEDALMGRAAGTIAHEIKNPVNTIFMGLQRIYKESKNLDDVEKELISVLINSSKQIASITDNLKNYTAPFSPKYKKFDATKSLNTILKLYSAKFETEKTDIICDDSPFYIYADEKLLFTVFDNIIKNCAESVSYNGQINISLYEQKNKSTLKFSNTLEKTISQEEADKFKEPYYTTKIKGTGLGLAICDKIALAHRGSLDIISSGNKIEISLVLKKGDHK
jgi:signal transduction histidine kinase